MGLFELPLPLARSPCSGNSISVLLLSIPYPTLSRFSSKPCSRSRHWGSFPPMARNKFPAPPPPVNRSRLFRLMSGSDIVSQLEISKPEGKRTPEKRVNGIFWILLFNLGIYAADHLLQVRSIKNLYLHHNWPTWYQFVTATFCHANWKHLSSNLFFLYIFGKLVEEEEGNLALWVSYILTGAGANIVSWLVLSRNAVSIGASGAVFGLFAVSVLVKMSWDWRKILEVLILGQFVIEKVMEAAQASTGLSGSFALQNVNHIAHLSGALIGVVLVWLLSWIPSQAPDPDAPTKRGKSKKS